MAWDTAKTDGVDSITASNWNDMATAVNGKSLSSHTHTEFAAYPYSDGCWYVYKNGANYYAKNLTTGTIDYSGVGFNAVMTSVIGAITNGGHIQLGAGTFTVTDKINLAAKGIIVEGMGWGRLNPPTYNPVTKIMTSAASPNGRYVFQLGIPALGGVTLAAGVRNLCIANDPANTVSSGAIDIESGQNCFVDRCYIRDFELGSPTAMNAIIIQGNTSDAVGGMYNHVTNCRIINADVGILLGPNANDCLIQGNTLEGSGTDNATGLKFDGTGASIPSPLRASVIGNVFTGFSHNGPSRGIWVTAGSNNSGRHHFIGNTFINNFINFEITSGTGIGECTFVANHFGNSGAGGSKTLDNGNIQSYYYNNKNYVTETWGAAASKTDGSTITHGLETTPTVVQVTGTVATEVVSVTAKGTTTFTLAIKKFTAGTPGSWGAGTSQTIYWRAQI